MQNKLSVPINPPSPSYVALTTPGLAKGHGASGSQAVPHPPQAMNKLQAEALGVFLYLWVFLQAAIAPLKIPGSLKVFYIFKILPSDEVHYSPAHASNIVVILP